MDSYLKKYRERSRLAKEKEYLEQKCKMLEARNSNFANKTLQLLLKLGMSQNEIFEFYLKENGDISIC